MKIEIGSRTTTIDLSTPQKFARALTSPDLTASVTTVVTASDHAALLRTLNQTSRPYAVCVITRAK